MSRPWDRTPTLVSVGRAFGLHGPVRPLVATSSPRRQQARPVHWRDDVRRLGVGRFLADCELAGAPEPDPGHPAGLAIALWRPPRRYGRDLVLEAFNGTRDPGSGLYERVLLRVPATCRTPVEAAAWTYGTDPDTYRGLLRRT